MQMLRLRSPRAVWIALLLLTCVIASPRGATAQDPASFINNLGTRGLQALQTRDEARFRQLLQQNFDLQGIGRFVLGPYARSMSPTTYQSFVPLFRDYLVRVYSTRLSRYANAPFRVSDTRPYGGETVVTSHVWPSGSPVRIDWHVDDRDGRLQVTDVVVDGVSMKATQRGEFASIIQRNGGHPEALIAVLRQQLAQAQ